VRRSRLVSHILTLVGGATAVVCVALSPPLRDGLIAIEPSVASLLFFAALIGAGVCWRARRRADARLRSRRLAARAGRWLDRWGWALAVLAMLAPLWSQWALKPPGGTTALAALLGHLPWSDALGHFEGGVRLLYDGTFGPYSERRPLNAAWLAVRLAVSGGSLPAALASQAVVLGLAAYALCRVIGRRFGLWPALAAFALLQGLARDGIPTAATEPLGITLACLALTLLLSRNARSRLAWMAAALFAMDVALNARPGPQLLLPALLLWGVWVFRRRWLRATIVLAAAWALSALVTYTLNDLYGSGEGSFASYPAYTFYGLTRDSNYRQAQHDYREEIAALPSEREVARFLYARAFDALRREPQLFMRALAGNELKFFEKLGANLSRIVTLRAPFASAQERARPSVVERRANLALGLPFLLAAAGLSLVRISRTGSRVDRLFWLAACVGVLGSVPLVYGDAGFRGLAASYPFFALFLALGLGRRRGPLASEESEAPLLRWSAAAVLAILLLSLSVPAVAHRLWTRPNAESRAGLMPGKAMLVSVDAAPAVLVSRSPRAGLGRVPWIREWELGDLLALAEIEPETRLAQLQLPFALIAVYDHVTRRAYLMAGPVDLLRQRGFMRVDVAPLSVDGRIVRDSRLLPRAAAGEDAAAPGDPQ
jgi:hypothetical protein